MLAVSIYLSGCFLGATIGVQKALESGSTAPVAQKAENRAPIISISTITSSESQENGALAGAIRISYTTQDAEADPVDITVDYSVDGGGTFQTASEFAGSDGIEDLDSSVGGTTHTFVWDSIANIGAAASSAVMIRMGITDGDKEGPEFVSQAFSIDNNSAPIAEVETPTGTLLSGDITINYRIIDVNEDLASVTIRYSIDGGKTFQDATEQTVGGVSQGRENLASTSGSNTVDPNAGKHVFVWDSLTDVGLTRAELVQMRIRPSDDKLGSSATTGTFVVDNNSAPVLSALSVDYVASTTDTVTGDVTFEYTLTDTFADDVDLIVQYSLDGVNWTNSTIKIGSGTKLSDLTSSPAGEPGFFVWNTLANLGQSYTQNVKVRFIPSDEFADGASVETAALKVDNNTKPVLTLVTDLSGDSNSTEVVCVYKIKDIHSDPADILVEYSVGGGSWSTATEMTSNSLSQGISNLTSSAGGVQGVFVWDTAALGVGLFSSVQLRFTPTDTTDGSVGDTVKSGFFTVDTTQPPVVSIASLSGTLEGDIAVTYFLQDSQSNPVSISVEYFDPSTNTWKLASPGTGGEPTVGLTSSPSGTSHLYVWNSLNDLGLTPTTNARIRITPADTLQGEPVSSPPLIVDNSSFAQANTPPIVIVQPISSASGTPSGDITVDYFLADTDSHNAGINVEYSYDGGSQWFSATEKTGGLSEGLTNLSTGPFPGTQHKFIWDSANASDLQGQYKASVLVRIRPSDVNGTGSASTTPTFSVDNNAAPTVTITDLPNPSTLSQTITYTVFDTESNPVDMSIRYRIGTGSWIACAAAAGSPGKLGKATSPAGISHTFIWDTLVDLGTTNTSNVSIRIVATDAVKSGPASISNTFSVNNNGAPVITINTPSGVQSGPVTINYEIRDSNPLDLVNINVEYSVDGGTNWAAAAEKTGSSSHGTTGLSASPTGVNHIFVWDSSANFASQYSSSVKFRIRGSDAFATGSYAETTQFTVDNTTAPSITALTMPGAIVGFQSGSGPVDISVSYTLVDAESQLCNILVEYSLDNGSSWFTAAEGTGGDGTTSISSNPAGIPHTFVWNSASTGTNTYSTQTKLRITPSDTRTGASFSSTTFTLDNRGYTNTPPAVSIVTPGGIKTGDVTISFTITEPDSIDQGQTAINVQFNGGSVGSTWTNANTTGATSNLGNSTYQIVWKSGIDQPGQDASNYRFRIQPYDPRPGGTGAWAQTGTFTVDNKAPVVTVTKPNGGELIKGGSGTSYNVTWGSVENHKANVLIEGSTDGGSSWTTITSSTTDDGAWTWTPVNSINSDTIKVRITATDQVGLMGSDTSNSNFSIDSTPPSVSVTTPGTVSVAQVVQITWVTTEVHPGGVVIDYDTDGTFDDGTGGGSIATLPTDTGTYSWTVPNKPGSNNKIRVVHTDGVGYTGTGISGSFQILPTTVSQSHTISSQSNFAQRCPSNLDVYSSSGSVVFNKVFARTWKNIYTFTCADYFSGDTSGGTYILGGPTGAILTKNGGTSWTVIDCNSSPRIPNPNVYDVKFFNGDSTGNTFLIGTAWGAMLTRDGGSTYTYWNNQTIPAIPNSVVNAVDFYELDPDGKTFAIATTGGLAITRNGGRTFTNYTTGSSPALPGSSNNIKCFDFHDSGGTSPTRYLFGTDSGAIISRDSGASFSLYSTSSTPALETNNVAGVDFHDATASGARWAVITVPSGGDSNIHITIDDGTVTWTGNGNNPNGSFDIRYELGSSYDDGYSVEFANWDPTGNTIALGTRGGMFITTSGGTTTGDWTKYTGNGLPNQDVRDLAFHRTQNNKMLAATPSGGGTHNSGAVTSPSFNQKAYSTVANINKVNDIAYYDGDSTSNTFLLATNAGVFYTSNGGASFTRYHTGASPALISDDVRAVAFYNGGNGNVWGCATSAGTNVTWNNGTSTFNLFDSGTTGIDSSDHYDFAILDHPNPSGNIPHFLIATDDGISKSHDGGSTWSRISEGNGAGQTDSRRIRGVDFYDGDATGNTWGAVTHKRAFNALGEINVTTNDGSQFTKTTFNSNDYYNCIEFLNATSMAKILVGSTNGLGFSADAGANYNVIGGLPSNDIQGVAYLQDGVGSLFLVATNGGLAITSNAGGAFWSLTGGTWPALNAQTNVVRGVDWHPTSGNLAVAQDVAGALVSPLNVPTYGTMHFFDIDLKALITPDPGTLIVYEKIKLNIANKPANTEIKIQLYKNNGDVISDTDMPGNSSWLTPDASGEINISALPVSSYPKFQMRVRFESSVSYLADPGLKLDDITIYGGFQ
ncbi:MAG: hypothetical protein NUW37_00200 [Planctomycetes bacterium]|nr:hypothetical protein [Planctomycetota bacterium]